MTSSTQWNTVCHQQPCAESQRSRHGIAQSKIFARTVCLLIFNIIVASWNLNAEELKPAIEKSVSASAKHAMVVSVHREATDAGVRILKSGGNAVDAAVAVGFALAVVYPQAGNLGGGGFMLVRMHTGEAHFIDYREQAPLAASADMYLDDGRNVIAGASTTGYKAIAVPGTVAGLAYAEKRYGKLTLAQVMAPAIELAREGFLLPGEEARTLSVARNLPKFADSRRIFQRDGRFYQADERFSQPELARTLERIAQDPATFYRGAMADELADAVQKGGGVITKADLAAYRVEDRVPLNGRYRDCQIITAPPPSSGGVVLLETLNILSGYKLEAMGARTARQVHTIVEAFRRAFMDRGDYLGDPAFAAMPIQQLTDPEYAAAWSKSIDPIAPSPSASLRRPAGFLPEPPQVPAAAESTQTTHYSIVDAEGNAVANTYTLNGLFGSGVTAGSLGFLLNNEMDDFSSKPGAPNMFGLVQGPNNAIAPRKRPLSSMTPTIVLRNGSPLLVLGSPGGSTIPSTVANDIISIVDNHLNVQQADAAPRFHHQYQPDRIEVEKAFPLEVVKQLREAGYQVNRSNEADEKNPGVWGDSEMILIDAKSHMIHGADDPRHNFGKAAGY